MKKTESLSLLSLVLISSFLIACGFKPLNNVSSDNQSGSAEVQNEQANLEPRIRYKNREEINATRDEVNAKREEINMKAEEFSNLGQEEQNNQIRETLNNNSELQDVITLKEDQVYITLEGDELTIDEYKKVLEDTKVVQGDEKLSLTNGGLFGLLVGAGNLLAAVLSDIIVFFGWIIGDVAQITAAVAGAVQALIGEAVVLVLGAAELLGQAVHDIAIYIAAIPDGIRLSVCHIAWGANYCDGAGNPNIAAWLTAHTQPAVSSTPQTQAPVVIQPNTGDRRGVYRTVCGGAHLHNNGDANECNFEGLVFNAYQDGKGGVSIYRCRGNGQPHQHGTSCAPGFTQEGKLGELKPNDAGGPAVYGCRKPSGNIYFTTNATDDCTNHGYTLENGGAPLGWGHP